MLGGALFPAEVSSLKLCVQTLLGLAQGNRAVARKHKEKNVQSKMTESRFLSVYAEGMLQTCMGELPGKESGINRARKKKTPRIISNH